MFVDFKHLNLCIDNSPIERIGQDCKESSFKFVGVKIDEFLNWKDHILTVKSKLASATFALSRVRNFFCLKTLN